MQAQIVPVNTLNLAGSQLVQADELVQVWQVVEQDEQLAPPLSKNPLTHAHPWLISL